MRSFKWQYLCVALVLSACGGSSSEGDSTAQEAAPVVAESLQDTTVSTVDDSTETQETASEEETAGEQEAPPISQPELISGEEMLELCPSADAVSTATGVEFTQDLAQALLNENDPLGQDSATGSTTCSYQTADSDLVVVLHGSSIDTSFFLEADFPDIEVTELASGAVQVQFEGQPSCEIYEGQTSAIFFTATDSTDGLCDVAAAAAEAAQ